MEPCLLSSHVNITPSLLTVYWALLARLSTHHNHTCLSFFWKIAYKPYASFSILRVIAELLPGAGVLPRG